MCADSFGPVNLRCEYAETPLGLERTQPRFAWQVPANVRGQRQTAYQIQVAADAAGLADGAAGLWDSSKVDSDRCIQVPYAGTPLASGQRAYWRVRIWDKDGQPSPFSAASWFEMGLLHPQDWTASWIEDEHEVGPGREQPSSMLRKEFSLPAPIVRARAYMSALGLYEAHINGRPLGQAVLAPEWTDYRRRVQYQTYDVTAILQPGNNCVGAMLGYGWYAGRIGLAPKGTPPRYIYGERPRFLCQIEVELEDGSHYTLVSDGTWRSTSDGPVVNSCILDGETQDLRRAKPGWNRPGFNDRAWHPVRVADITAPALVSQYNEPIQIMHELTPVALTQPNQGVFVFDMGQNMVGWCRLKVRGDAGNVVRLRHAEALQPDGNIYTENLRTAAQINTYTLSGVADEILEPHFTYQGFRYVEVTGLSEALALASLTGCVFYSGAPAAGHFECSDPMVNQVIHNIVWTQRGNMHSSPTDCPQRDERLGWMGDAGLFSQTASFNMNMARFYTKWLLDVRDAQSAEGTFADVSPNPYAPLGLLYGAPGWGDAGVIVPWRMYENYADTGVLQEHLSAAEAWVNFIQRNNPDLVWRERRGNDYGDWLNADTFILDNWPSTGGQVPKEVYATAFIAHSADLLSRMAAVLGDLDRTAQYGELFGQIRAAFNAAFVAPDGRILGDTQAGYALALHFNLLPEGLQAPALEHMLEGIERYGGRLSTGIQSTHRMMLELVKRGRADVAYRLLLSRVMPSWGYMVDQGATTIWERWDGYVEGRGFQKPSMNSFNHVAIGAVGEWLYRVVAGINPDENEPGFKHSVIRPVPGGGLSHARADHDTIHGRLSSAWRLDGDAFTLEVSIPGNTTATVYLPVADAATVRENGAPVAEAEGVTVLGPEDGRLALDVDSGHYTFTTTLAN